LDSNLEVAAVVARYNQGCSLAKIFEILNHELLATSVALDYLHIVPRWADICLTLTCTDQFRSFLVLATVLIVEPTECLVMLRDVPAGSLRILCLLLQRGQTVATPAHRLDQRLVRLIFTEVVSARAVQFRR
jgi:hypothetical protein